MWFSGRSLPKRITPSGVALALLAVTIGALLARSLRHEAPGASVTPPPPEVSHAYQMARRRQREALAGYLRLCRRHHRRPDPAVVKNLQDPNRTRWYLAPAPATPR